VTLTYNYCRDGAGGLCKLGTLAWSIPIEAAAEGSATPIRLPVK
jgi:hypothetical protein